MYEKTDKRRLYWLIDMYLSKKINAVIFCDEYYYSYCLELDQDTLTELERKEFSELDTISGRFSQFEDDFIKYPGIYYTEIELREKITGAQAKLNKEQVFLLQTFSHDDKRKLYWLINQYLLNNIDIQFFCDEFVECYTIGVDNDLFTKLECKAFADLNLMAANFSKFKDDFQCLLEGTFYLEKDLNKKVIETKALLNKYE